MKIGELKEPYRSLAVLRTNEYSEKEAGLLLREEAANGMDLITAFGWIHTPEGGMFWKEVNEGLTPEIPKQ